MIERYVVGSDEVDAPQVALVGGKGAQLGELLLIEGVSVPSGFCVTTDAFRRIMARVPSVDDWLDRLSRLNPDDREVIRRARVIAREYGLPAVVGVEHATRLIRDGHRIRVHGTDGTSRSTWPPESPRVQDGYADDQ